MAVLRAERYSRQGPDTDQKDACEARHRFMPLVRRADFCSLLCAAVCVCACRSPCCASSVNVKWGKESYDIDSGSSFDELQALLFSLTFVPLDRQKIMSKGKMIKDSAAVSALKEGDKLVLMGTAEPPPKEPEKKTVFVEDMSEAQKIAVVKDMLSAGLHNLGNTSDTQQHSAKAQRSKNWENAKHKQRSARAVWLI